MRLYVLCPNTLQRIYLDSVVEYRSQLAPWFTLNCPHEHGVQHEYNNNDVIPEPEGGMLTSGAVVVGLVGLLGGPIGIILGGASGATLGASAEEEEQRRIRRFG